LMSLVYPGSLGLDEGIAHLTMKGSMAMLADCGLCQHWVLYFFLVLWISSSVATAWWLKVVFARYETTSALPVEYGMVNLVSVCSGLIFYNESKYMEAWQLLCSISGVALVLLGIQCSTLKALPFGFLGKHAVGAVPGTQERRVDPILAGKTVTYEEMCSELYDQDFRFTASELLRRWSKLEKVDRPGEPHETDREIPSESKCPTTVIACVTSSDTSCARPHIVSL